MALPEVVANHATDQQYAFAMQPACRWIHAPDSAYLHWNYSCIATVKPEGDWFETVITWCDREHRGRACSLAQGMRFVERWVSAREGLPRRRGGTQRR